MKKFIKQRAQRGAIFVESIIVLSFFILCFLGTLYFRELYLAKLRVQRLARASAMAHAMGACQGDPRAGLEKDLPAQPLEKQTEDSQKPLPIDTHGDKKADEALANLDQTKAGTPLNKITTITLRTTASAMTKADPQGKKQGFESDVASVSFVSCGDPVRDGQYEEILPHIESIFESFF